jgi:hypothetical protein
LFELYEKYNLTISHEDFHGSFELEYNRSDAEKERDKNWMNNARVVINKR